MFYQIKVGSININEIKEKKIYSIIIIVVFIIIGILLLIIGSHFFVDSAVIIAKKFGVQESIIGVSLVAFGTSLPELVVGIISAIRKKVDFALFFSPAAGNFRDFLAFQSTTESLE